MNQISNALKSTVTEVVMLSLICCMVTSTVALQSSGSWSDALVAVAIIEFVMLVGWLGWLTYIFLTKNHIYFPDEENAVGNAGKAPKRI